MIMIPVLFITVVVVGYSIYFTNWTKRKITIRIEGDYLLDSDRELGFIARKSSASVRRDVKSGNSYKIFIDERGARVSAKV